MGGVPLGAQIDQVMPKCVGYKTQSLCSRPSIIADANERFREIDGFPTLGFPVFGHSVSLHEGAIESLSLLAHRHNWSQLKQLLVERFGPPHNISQERVTTRAGAQLQSESLVWMGAKTVIVADERAAQIDQSGVSFRDVATARASEASKARAAKQGAGKL